MLPYLFTASVLLFVFSLGYYLFLRQGPSLPLRRRVMLLGIAGVLLLPLCPSPILPEAVNTTEPAAVMMTDWRGDEVKQSMVAIALTFSDEPITPWETAILYAGTLSPADCTGFTIPAATPGPPVCGFCRVREKRSPSAAPST